MARSLPPTGKTGARCSWSEQTDDPATVLDTFSKLVPLSDSERARILRELRTHQRFVPVMLQDFLSWDEMARIEVNAPDLPGILIDVGTTRIYPQSGRSPMSSAMSRRPTTPT